MRPYLPERFGTIFNQTLQDWELIVYDGLSDDGSWEYILRLAEKEPRMRVAQGPRKGVYDAWNHCVKMARGEYIYIATSDDTMVEDCLQKLAAALDRSPDCGIAHCCATFIDERGMPCAWKWEQWPATAYFEDLVGKAHMRPRGHDTLVALAFTTPYFSFTQLMIRRSVFRSAGLFETGWGPAGDLAWQLRATQVTSTIHVPEYLATWRMHPAQASGGDSERKARVTGAFVRMAEEAIRFSCADSRCSMRPLPARLKRFFLADHFFEVWRAKSNIGEKLQYLASLATSKPGLATYAVLLLAARRLRLLPARSRLVRRELEVLGIGRPRLI
jgi:hypothetical protein